MARKIFLGFLIALLIFSVYVIQAGVAVVQVRTPDVRLWVPVPIALGHLAGQFVDLPLHKSHEFKQFLKYRYEIGEILRQVEDLPDCDLVEVSKRNERVRIYKRGDSLIVDVKDMTEEVRVRVRVRTLSHLADTLTQPEVTVGDLFACLRWEHLGGDLVHVKTNHEEVRIAIW